MYSILVFPAYAGLILFPRKERSSRLPVFPAYAGLIPSNSSSAVIVLESIPRLCGVDSGIEFLRNASIL